MAEIRKTSETPFPHGGSRLCYFEVREGEPIGKVNRYRVEFRDAVKRALAGESTLYAAWPGEHRTDLFVVDDVPALAAAIGAGAA